MVILPPKTIYGMHSTLFMQPPSLSLSCSAAGGVTGLTAAWAPPVQGTVRVSHGT